MNEPRSFHSPWIVFMPTHDPTYSSTRCRWVFTVTPPTSARVQAYVLGNIKTTMPYAMVTLCRHFGSRHWASNLALVAQLPALTTFFPTQTPPTIIDRWKKSGYSGEILFDTQVIRYAYQSIGTQFVISHIPLIYVAFYKFALVVISGRVTLCSSSNPCVTRLITASANVILTV
jgi:hypothetical protein